MSKKRRRYSPFHSAFEEVPPPRRRKPPKGARTYADKLAFTDQEFLLREELRPVRLQLELLRPELVLQDHQVENTLVVFGSARIPPPEVAKQNLDEAEAAYTKNPTDQALAKAMKRAQHILENSAYLKEATKLAEMASQDPKMNYYIVTGGGPGFMEAANKGAFESNARSLALNMILPNEQIPNAYVTPELTFQFHYFAIRKMHFLMRAKALVAFPGGFGTFDELFETLTLLQTKKIDRIPLLLFNKSFWQRVVNFDALVEEGTVGASDLDIFQYVETAEEAWDIIDNFYK